MPDADQRIEGGHRLSHRGGEQTGQRPGNEDSEGGSDESAEQAIPEKEGYISAYVAPYARRIPISTRLRTTVADRLL